MPLEHAPGDQQPAGIGRAARRAVEEHLGSRDVARVIYGTVVGLALVLALQQHPPAAGVVAGALIATGVAIGLAELYSELVGFEARARRPVGRAQLRTFAADSLAVTVGAGFPAVFFLLATTGVLDLGTAFTAAKWSGIGLLCGYGFVAARVSGAGPVRALAHAAAVGAIGGLLIGIKALLH